MMGIAVMWLAAPAIQNPPVPPVREFECTVRRNGRVERLTGSTGEGVRRYGPVMAGGDRSYHDRYPNARIHYEGEFAGRTPTSVTSGHYANIGIAFGERRDDPRLILQPTYRNGQSDWRLIVLSGRRNHYGECQVRSRAGTAAPQSGMN